MNDDAYKIVRVITMVLGFVLLFQLLGVIKDVVVWGFRKAFVRS